jgi:hypothetical protein
VTSFKCVVKEESSATRVVFYLEFTNFRAPGDGWVHLPQIPALWAGPLPSDRLA